MFKFRIKMKTFKSGNYINQGTYKSFQPTKINQKWAIDDMEVLNLLSQADRQLGRLDMYSESSNRLGNKNLRKNQKMDQNY